MSADHSLDIDITEEEWEAFPEEKKMRLKKALKENYGEVVRFLDGFEEDDDVDFGGYI